MIWKRDDYGRKKLTDDVHRKRKKRNKQRSRTRKQKREKKLDLNYRKDYKC